MKKVLLTLGVLALFSESKAQGTLAKNDAQINAGFGLSTYGLPVYGGFDYGLGKNFTIGAEGAYRGYKNFGYRFSIISIGVNGNYHFNEILKLPAQFDFYAGLNLTYFNWSSPRNYVGSYASELGLGLQVGGRYFFNDQFGINLELGGGSALSGGKVGITVKL